MHLHLERAWIDDLKIHDPVDATCPYSLRSARRTVAPRTDVIDRTNRHGVIDRTKFYGGQTVDLAGYVSHNDGHVATEDAYDDLRAAVAVPGSHVFRFRRYGRSADEQIVFRQTGGFDAPAEGWSEIVRWAGALLGADPRVYGAALKSASYDPSQAIGGGGLAMPLTFPLVFPTTTASLLEITNDGTYATPPVFTIDGPVIDPIVDLLETGESIVLQANLGASDTLVVDVAARATDTAVLLNGASRLDLLVASLTKWFELVRGTNRLRLRGSGMSAGVTNLTVSYRDARI